MSEQTEDFDGHDELVDMFDVSADDTDTGDNGMPPIQDESDDNAEESAIDENTDQSEQEQPAVDTKETKGLISAVQALRAEKRAEQERNQALAAELEQLRAQLGYGQHQQPNQQNNVQEFEIDETIFENPARLGGYLNHAVEQRVSTAVREIEQKMEIRFQDQVHRAKYPDFDQAIEACYKAGEVDPSIARAAFASPNPHQFAYEFGKRLLDNQKLQDPDYFEKMYQERLAKDGLAVGNEPQAQAQKPALRNLARASGSAPKNLDNDASDLLEFALTCVR